MCPGVFLTVELAAHPAVLASIRTAAPAIAKSLEYILISRSCASTKELACGNGKRACFRRCSMMVPKFSCASVCAALTAAPAGWAGVIRSESLINKHPLPRPATSSSRPGWRGAHTPFNARKTLALSLPRAQGPESSGRLGGRMRRSANSAKHEWRNALRLLRPPRFIHSTVTLPARAPEHPCP
jgi:hypothetical protein